MQVGVLGAFRVASSPFPPKLFYPSFPADQLWGPGLLGGLLGPEATSSAPRTPRAFCRTFFVPPIARYAVDGLGLILPEGVVPRFTGEAYADLKEVVIEVFKSLANAATSVCPGRTGLWVLGWASPNRPSPPRLAPPAPPPSASMTLGVDVLRVWKGKIWRSPQSLTMTATPRSRTAGWVCGPTAGRGVSWAFPTLTSCASGVVGLDDFSESFMARMEGHKTSGFPFSDTEASQVPIACFPLTGASF
ncbi:hypothetical protein GWK47_043917 [Chionoecetes opilio]|uniref:Uncharacterized protein n=1 Tax=Chionoecetes opilio TaxID=41210 RepID=A0A8J4YFP7_CHIOP|nr:hypothetical protein GWK47_043917 [Chionoecetes opilio]